MLRTTISSAGQRIVYGLILLMLSASVLFSQNLVNSGTFTNNSGGVIKVKGTFTPGQTTYGGTVEFYKSGAQTVPAITYTNIKATGASGDKTFATGKTVVTGDVTINQTSNGFILSASDTLDLQKITTVPVTLTSGTFDVSAGTTRYNNGAQVIYGTTYKNLVTSSGNKTTSGNVTVSSGGTLTNSVTLDFGSNGFVGTGATFANSSVLQSAGSVTLSGTTSVDGTFRYNSGGAQSIANAIYTGTLDVQGAGAKTIGDVTINGTYSTAGGARTYNGTVTYGASGAQTVMPEGYNNLTLSGSGTKTISSAGATLASTLTASVPVSIGGSGDLTLAASSSATFSDNLTVDGTFDASASSSTVTFNGGAQSIGGTTPSGITFNNLTLSGTAAKTSSLTLNVGGTLTPTRGIDMGSSAVMNITNTAAAAVGSFGTLEEIKGNMKRAIGSTGQAFTMNDSATILNFATTAPTDFTLKVEPTTSPTGYAATTHVQRKVTASYTGTFSGLTMKLGYANAEKPSQDEAKLRFFKGAGVKLATGNAAVRTSASSSSWGQVSLAGITSGASTSANAQLPTGTEVIMSNSGAAIVTIADAADWNTTTTWDEGRVPTSGDDVQISNTGVAISSDAVASTVLIDASKSLLVNGANLTVSGSLTNNGSLSISNTRTLTVASSGTGTLNNAGTITNDGTVQIGD